MFDSRLKGCKFDPGSRQRGSALSLTLAELYGLKLPSLGDYSIILLCLMAGWPETSQYTRTKASNPNISYHFIPVSINEFIIKVPLPTTGFRSAQIT